MSASEKIIKTFIAKFKADGRDLEVTYQRLGNITDKFVNAIEKAFSGMSNIIMHPIKSTEKILKALGGSISKVFKGIINVIRHPIDSIKKAFSTLGGIASKSLKFALVAPFKAMEATARLSIKAVSKMIKGIPAIASFAFDKLSSITTAFTDSMGAFLDFDAKSSLSPDYVSRLADAMTSVGGTTDDAINTLDILQQSLMDTSFGQGSLIEAAKKWGLTLHDSSGQLLSADKMLIEISKRMQRMSKAEQVDLVSTLGLNDSALRFLQEGPLAIQNKMANAAFVINEKDIEAAKNLRESTARIKQTFKAIGLDIQRIVIPFIDKALGAIKEIPSALRKIFTDTKIGKGISKTIEPFFRYFSRQMQRVKTLLRGLSIDNFMQNLPKLKEFFKATIADVSGSLKNIVANGFSFLKENGPTIGSFIVEALKTAFDIAKSALPNLAGFIGEAIGTSLKAIINVGKWIAESIQSGDSGSIIGAIKNLLSSIGGLVKDIFVSFWNGLLGAAFNTSLGEIANNIKEWAKSILPDFVVDKLFKDKEPMPLTSPATQEQIAQLNDIPLNNNNNNMPIVSPITNTTTNASGDININAPINITNAKNPDQVGKAVRREVMSLKAAAVQGAGGLQ
ncbi:MAG: hypothetical protein K2G70_06925 [Turicibacter sp.]|nr:hypothetical protein [Turicibacter sp.]